MPNEADPKIDSNKTQKVSAYPTLGVLLLLCGSLWGQANQQMKDQICTGACMTVLSPITINPDIGTNWTLSDYCKVPSQVKTSSGRVLATCIGGKWEIGNLGELPSTFNPELAGHGGPEPDVPAIQEKHTYPLYGRLAPTKNWDDPIELMGFKESCHEFTIGGEFVEGKGCVVPTWTCADPDRILLTSVNGKHHWCHLPQEAKP